MDEGADRLDDDVEGLSRLTPRERDCLRLVDQHLSSKEIARRLGLSKHTVDWHLDKARRRLGAADRYEAARLLAPHIRAEGAPFDASRIPSGTPPPIASGSDAARLADEPDQGSTSFIEVQRPQGQTPEEGTPRDETDGPTARGDRPGSESAPRRAALPERLAPSEPDGRTGARLHLDGAGAPVVQPGGRAPGGLDGLGPGQRNPQAGSVQAAGNGAARDPVRGGRSDGRELPDTAPAGRLLGSWGGPNDLSLAQRLGVIAALMIAIAFAFGSLLAGLHALRGLF
ncbi:MAG: LuxR family transcriptional regulator [Caulobacter sp.]|nr:LuxR family transcriptional regulator [Caulobacter sp.]